MSFYDHTSMNHLWTKNTFQAHMKCLCATSGHEPVSTVLIFQCHRRRWEMISQTTVSRFCIWKCWNEYSSLIFASWNEPRYDYEVILFFFSSRITGVMGQNKVMQIGTCNCRSRIVTSLCLFPPSPLTIATCPSVQYRSGEDFFQNLHPKMYFRNIRNLALSASTDGKSVTCHGKQH